MDTYGDPDAKRGGAPASGMSAVDERGKGPRGGGVVGGHGGESVRPQRAFRKLPLTRVVSHGSAE